MQPIDCRMCRTKNHAHLVDAHINHIETDFVHYINSCDQSYTHYWEPLLLLYGLLYTARSFVTAQFLINCYPSYLSERWYGPITFRCFWPAIVLATVPDLNLGSRSGSKPNRWQICCPGYEYTQTVNAGTVRWWTDNPSKFGGLSAGRPAGPSIDSFKTLVIAVC
jgi:hypothetical protein